MSRQESDREDLMAEATGLTDRVELRLNSFGEVLVAGFRRNAAVSLFFGQSEVYQFNAQRQFRRGYWRDVLIKAEHGRLVSLTRHREETRTVLARHEFNARETDEFLFRMQGRLQQLRSSLDDDSFHVRSFVAASGTDVVARLHQWLRELPQRIEIATSPRCGSIERGAPIGRRK